LISSLNLNLSEVRTDQEKDRLAHMMAYGIDPAKIVQREPSPPPPCRELDRFDERIRKEICFFLS